jgi:glycerol uptake facilitator protein
MADLGMISLAFGTIVIATVYALGHVGGNHINPAVTLGLAVSGKFPWSQVPGYIAAQVVGAVVGATAHHRRARTEGERRRARGRVVQRISWAQAFTAEFVGTFILVFTIFGVITARRPPASPGLASGSWCSPRSSRSPPPPAPRSTRRVPSARCWSSRSPAAT